MDDDEVGPCFACKDLISGAHVATSDAKFHMDCFRCYHCLRNFPNDVFFEDESGIYCEEDYHMLVVARCGKCLEPITGKCISALENKWHVEHFVCENCGRSLAGGNYVRNDGFKALMVDKPYCKLCPTSKATSKKVNVPQDICEICKNPIDRYPLLFQGQKYHFHHFSCFVCHKQLDHTAREFEAEMYCFADYEAIQLNVCNACKKPIIGPSVSAMGKVFHIEHFVCYQCEKPFNGANHFDSDGHPYCEQHFKQVTGSVCHYCRKTVIDALGGKWCENHFQCMGCLLSLSDLQRSQFLNFDGKPYCRRCHDQLPGDVKRSMNRHMVKEAKYV